MRYLLNNNVYFSGAGDGDGNADDDDGDKDDDADRWAPARPPPPGRGQRPAAEEHFELLATPAAMATTVDGDAGRFKPYACDAATGMGVSPGGGGGLYPNASIQQYPLIPFRNVFLVTEIARRPRKTTKKKTRVAKLQLLYRPPRKASTQIATPTAHGRDDNDNAEHKEVETDGK